MGAVARSEDQQETNRETQAARKEPRDVTLLELVRSVSEVTENDREIVATVLHLLRTGRARLCGNFRGTHPRDLS